VSKRRIDLIVVVVLAALIVLTYLVATSAADAAYEGVSVKHARAHVQQAARRVREAQKTLADARRVLTATRRYSAQYGPAVSRWTWLSRDTGWGWSEIPQLLFIVDRESGGSESILNAQGSGACGLLQILPSNVTQPWRLVHGRYNLGQGLRLWRIAGWQPWTL
jgi:hypothetical protein